MSELSRRTATEPQFNPKKRHRNDDMVIESRTALQRCKIINIITITSQDEKLKYIYIYMGDTVLFAVNIEEQPNGCRNF